MTVPDTLDEERLHLAVDNLARQDRDLAAAVKRFGPPPLWPRQAGFESLARTILDQQVTLRSAEAAMERLLAAAGSIEPRALIDLGETGMREAGLTRQKARYLTTIAGMVVEGTLDVDGLASASDEDVRSTLTTLPGIGRWTADVYLVLALRRADAWPSGDLALAAGAQLVKGMDRRPTVAELDVLADSWRPWRGAAARILWHTYLSSRGRS